MSFIAVSRPARDDRSRLPARLYRLAGILLRRLAVRALVAEPAADQEPSALAAA
jgi:hypothetical protein